MALKSFLARIGAAGALAVVTLTPVAMADRGDRGERHYDRGDRWDRGDRGRHHRGDRNQRWDRGRHHRDWDRGRRHGNWDRGRNYRGNHYRDQRRYHAPRVVNRYYYSQPSYTYRTRPRVNYYYNSGYHHPRYRIGSYYSYGPSTVVISDYNRYGLYSPPRGHRWVHDRGSGDAVLTSVATGAIVGLAIGILSQ